MFGIFKKKESSSTSNPLAGFQSEFTKEQKAAIIGSLVIIAKSDGQVHPKEMQQIEQVAKLLRIDFDDPIFARSAQGGKDLMIKTLNTLTQSQKEWYVITLQGMVGADGKVEEVELSFALGICEDIGISEDKYIEIVEKAHLLMERFMGR